VVETSAPADLVGRTCLVTGASAGIGRAAAAALAARGARVLLGVRSPEKGERARRQIEAETGSRSVEVVLVDVASQESIRAFARGISQTLESLDVLVNNAGIWSEKRQTSPDGIELTWATNVLGYFLVTDLLLPLLRAAPRARVVNVASRLARDLDLGDVEFRRRPYSGQTAYAQSKQADRMLTWALARRLLGSSVTANAVHPGFVATEIFGKGGGLLSLAVSLYSKWKGKTPSEGADTVVWLAASPAVEGMSGRFFASRREWPCPYRDETQEDALWALCERMTGPSTRTSAGPS